MPVHKACSLPRRQGIDGKLIAYSHGLYAVTKELCLGEAATRYLGRGRDTAAPAITKTTLSS